MTKKLNALVIAIACLLMLPAGAFAQLPSPTYGWNLGNTLEPPCGEGCWAPAATQAMINAVADAGFNTIRIPVAWDSHANQSAPYTINASWLNRVKQVVDWSLAADLTVVVNTHWDGGWLENNIGNSVNPTINAKMNSYWTQIANTFDSYDDRLLFAAANEPNVDTAAEMSTLTAYYQTFVNAVRGTGGNNTSRWLVVQGPNTDINLTYSLMNTLPNDPTEDRLAVEVHYYDPWQFAGLGEDANWGDMFYFWGDDYESSTLPSRNATHSGEAHLAAQLQKMNTKFVSQGIPVILGEFGAMNRTGNPELTGDNLDLHLASREYYHQLFVDTANSLGIAPFYWDNGWTGANGSGIFDRNSTTVFDQDTVTAVTGGANQPGDFDADGDVDGHDFLAWQRNPSVGDLADWQAIYGDSSLAASTAVPEPSIWEMIALAMLVGSLASAQRSASTRREPAN
ncbi:glycoside hydrolase family 5 protein [Bythopirellula goksoeyrii]|uniref:Endoglucanase A n=1 Tax=Bythopirellula goksoeyrii TaxID=1400387 RepID=A0A5B9QE36_9BACT|nr:glycoside hydrolase family 5 protein [Bythopirellula goksoeyrii]QEG37238.1 Endoglucanase A precursor [Bythopirellula goksoeyrii]